MRASSSVYAKRRACEAMVGGLCSMNPPHEAENLMDEMRGLALKPSVFEFRDFGFSGSSDWVCLLYLSFTYLILDFRAISNFEARLQGGVVGVGAAPSLPLSVEGQARRLIAEAGYVCHVGSFSIVVSILLRQASNK
ncbi:hypothetical protein Acr_00g0015620 [Actinidia rufa]|uniref:Uncharacterized protein n=1 Tax=Actinidia rufa TaxID=165716 RepID=A0A7J0DC19_9ERIC|nr:hypothetical protein Acr_00g0015620 [Actinidia rufa]